MHENIVVRILAIDKPVTEIDVEPLDFSFDLRRYKKIRQF